MIEKVARALCAADNDDPDGLASDIVHRPPHGNKFVDVPAWTKRTKEARAAIEAMKEPTPQMTKAGYDHSGSSEPVDLWRAMVKVALVDR